MSITADKSKMEIKGDDILGKRTKVEFIESYIKIGNSDYQWNDNHGELIRCKDCIHWYRDSISHLCRLTGDLRKADFYCADGEREDT